MYMKTYDKNKKVTKTFGVPGKLEKLDQKHILLLLYLKLTKVVLEVKAFKTISIICKKK